MTLTTTRSREQYEGDGKQQLWPVSFAFVQPEHVRAVRGEVRADLVLETDLLVGAAHGIALAISTGWLRLL